MATAEHPSQLAGTLPAGTQLGGPKHRGTWVGEQLVSGRAVVLTGPL